MSDSVSVSTRLSGRRSRRSRWERTERSGGGGRLDAEKVEAEEKARELEQMLPLLLLEISTKMWSTAVFVQCIVCINK